MTDHISSLKEALEKYEAWLAAGLPIDGGPYDTYPDDLYQAATRPEAIRSLLAALDEATQPRPIATAPQDGTTILVWEVGADEPMTAYWQDGNGWCDNARGTLWGFEATHWLPVPKLAAIAAQETPPADGGGQSGGKAHFAAPKCLSENDYSVVDGGAGQGAIAAQEGGQDG